MINETSEALGMMPNIELPSWWYIASLIFITIGLILWIKERKDENAVRT